MSTSRRPKMTAFDRERQEAAHHGAGQGRDFL